VTDTRDRLLQQLQTVPEKPGVYIFKDSQGNILYVGKGRSLKKRMRSYFRSNSFSSKTALLAAKIADFDFFITNDEVEALILESNLIKNHKPPFNISLRDDKSFPSLAVTVSDEFPRVMVTRKLGIKGARYFGPYTNPAAVRETLDTLRQIFPVRFCRGKVPGKQGKGPCLNYHIEKCLGPCTGGVEREEYAQMIAQICLFLEGKHEKVIKQLETKMKEAASKLEYEKAARLRNRIQAARHVTKNQQVVSQNREDRDVVGQYADGEFVCIAVFFIRGGRLLGSENFIFDKDDYNEQTEVLSSFVKQFYLRATYIPGMILLPAGIEDQEVVANWLTGRVGKKVAVAVPKRGEKKKLVELANENARAGIEFLKLRKEFQRERAIKGLTELEQRLHLPGMPYRIEAFDISTLQGAASVGSMVVFENGKPRRQDYRRFKIRSVPGQDDFAMMIEVVGRRFANLKKEQGIDEGKFGIKPELVIIDGGKPQLSAALHALQKLEIDDVPVVALAKREEEVYLPHQSSPIKMPSSSPGLKLIQAIRDEAHRFAVRYHRNLRDKISIASVLDEIPGVGKKRKKILIEHFGSAQAIFEASVQELLEVPHLPSNVADGLYMYLHGQPKEMNCVKT
jgi:excinuclease ABC subunit C